MFILYDDYYQEYIELDCVNLVQFACIHNKHFSLFLLVEGLYNWCQSISNHAVENSHLDTITNNFKVTCGSKKIDYDGDKLKDIGPKILLDSNRVNASQKTDLYSLWSLHPDLRAHCCFANSPYHNTITKKLIRFEDSFSDYIDVLTSRNLIEEFQNVCLDETDDSFCTITHALCMVNKARFLPSSKQEWTAQDQIGKDAVLLNFIVLIKEKPTEFGPLAEVISNADQLGIYERVLNYILSSVQNTRINELKRLRCLLPSLDSYMPSTSSCNLDNLCIVLRTTEQLKIYMDEVDIYENVNGTKQVILNTGIDYKQFLAQKQLDRILQVLNEYQATSLKIANELKGHMTKKFSELRNYYEQIEQFNSEIVAADISYIQGRLTSVQTSVKTVVDSFKNNCSLLFVNLIIAATLEIVEETVQLALTISENSNPIGWLTGSASGKEIHDAVQELTDAIAKLAKGAALLSLWNNVKDKATEINNKVNANKDYLESVKNIVFEKETDFETSKTTFLSKYDKYDPKLTKDDIVEMAGLWSKLGEEACSVLESMDTVAASPFKIIVSSSNLCVHIPVLAQRMGDMYLSIYDFQFELMNALAAYMRSRVTLDAAKEINNEFTSLTEVNPESDTTLYTLQLMGGLTYLTFMAHILQTVNRYCSLLEYKLGGIQPHQCKGPETDLAVLVSTNIPSCVMHTYDFYYVPTAQNTTNSNSYTSVDTSELFAGATVNFKIPDSQWLIDNKWIKEYERDYAFYVEKFEVYLPTKSQTPQKIVAFADPILHNEIFPHGREYMIIPHIPFAHEYLLGPQRTVCHSNRKMPNPYTACESESTSTICQISQKNPRHVYPSIYSQWAISVKGAEHLTLPKPATDLSLIFGIQLCKHAPINVRKKLQTVFSTKKMDTGECCLSGQFRPNAIADCQTCPSGSHSALAGYYCEKDN